MTVWDDITSQAANLRRVIEAHTAAPGGELELAAQVLRQAGRIVYAGVGSGLNATLAACMYLNSRGFAAECLDATEAIYGRLPGLKGAALVLNTRSGETAELVKLAQLARQAGIPTVAVTNEPESRVGLMANACLPTYSRWDELVVLSAYGGMLASELILAAQVLDERPAMLERLSRVTNRLPGVFERVLALRGQASELFAAARPITLLGRGASMASAWGGGLVLEEMARGPVAVMAAGLFRQGPIEVVDQQFRAIVFEGCGEPAALNARLAQDLISLGAGLYWVGPTPVKGALHLELPQDPDYLAPLYEILPCQVLAYDLALAKGIQPGNVRYIQKVITEESGLPHPAADQG